MATRYSQVTEMPSDQSMVMPDRRYLYKRIKPSEDFYGYY